MGLQLFSQPGGGNQRRDVIIHRHKHGVSSVSVTYAGVRVIILTPMYFFFAAVLPEMDSSRSQSSLVTMALISDCSPLRRVLSTTGTLLHDNESSCERWNLWRMDQHPQYGPSMGGRSLPSPSSRVEPERTTRPKPYQHPSPGARSSKSERISTPLLCLS